MKYEAKQHTTLGKRELRKAILAKRREKYIGQDSAQSAKRILAVLNAEVLPILESIKDNRLSSETASGANLVASESNTGSLTIAGFMPTPAEASAMPFLRFLALTGNTILFPTFAGKMLNWRSWDGESEFVPSPGAKFGAEPTGPEFGIDALSKVDLVLAPAVAVDESGTRLGHGKGYYDKALQHLNPAAKVFAVVHESELLPAGSLPRESHDIPIHGVITEKGLTEF